MAIQLQGNAGTVADVDGTTHRAQRVTARPGEALGHYRFSLATGTIAAALAANAQIAQFKWTEVSKLAVITYVRVRFQTLTVFTSATVTDFGVNLLAIRPTYTGGGGGTTLTLTGNNAKMRTSQATSLATINVATTAALTLVTATLDAQPISQSIGHPNRRTPATAIEEPLTQPPLLEYNPDMGHGEHPLVLAQNEGFVIQNRTVWPAAGTGIFLVEVAWFEATAF